ncbi:MAG: hypothetical protein KF753_24670 [Caldilineaceae bacterium]|nr:hypothetical protein [Caldilineaceae bacterium]
MTQSPQTLRQQIQHWLLPPGVLALLQNRLSGRTTAVEREILAANASLHNRHTGERCFIIATGPSIKSQDLTVLAGETCIGVSNFFVHPDFALIRPRYYCIAPHHPPITVPDFQAWMRELEQRTSDNMAMFMGLADRQILQEAGLFSRRPLHFLKLGLPWHVQATRAIDITRAVPHIQSVTVMALLAALYMGFKEIYLLGCDHDWILHLNTSSHFYEEKEHKLVQAGYNEWFDVDFSSHCQDCVNLWSQYRTLRSIAQRETRHIVNVTAGGLLDVFPRAQLESVINSFQNPAK